MPVFVERNRVVEKFPVAVTIGHNKVAFIMKPEGRFCFQSGASLTERRIDQG